MKDAQDDLFDAKLNALAEQKANEIVKKTLSDPVALAEALRERSLQLAEATKEIEELKPQAGKWKEYMDSEGYVSCAKIADMLRLKYMTPSGKMSTMGRDKICQALAYDGVILKDGGGYRVSRAWYDYAKTFPMVDAGGVKRHSVKFNSDGVDKIIDKYNDDTRHWVSIQTSKGWSIKAI